MEGKKVEGYLVQPIEIPEELLENDQRIQITRDVFSHLMPGEPKTIGDIKSETGHSHEGITKALYTIGSVQNELWAKGLVLKMSKGVNIRFVRREPFFPFQTTEEMARETLRKMSALGLVSLGEK
jgi:hypothetical protein